ncbi:MAG: hypothetical protein Q4P29_01340 [Tissierellia bacterium]|nr:hypothetical protein [Tissierellia bacterium]
MRNYGKILDTALHIKEKYNDGWELSKGVYLKGYKIMPMNIYDEKRHCSLMSIAKIFQYFRDSGFNKIKYDDEKIFYTTLKIAKRRLFYTSLIGTQPFFIDNITNLLWKYFGYEAMAKNIIFFNGKKSFADYIIERLDCGCPLILSMFFGTYSRHTINIIGYKLYNRGEESKLYLNVDDNWSYREKYIDTSNFFTIKSPIFEICDPLYRIR